MCLIPKTVQSKSGECDSRRYGGIAQKGKERARPDDLSSPMGTEAVWRKRKKYITLIVAIQKITVESMIERDGLRYEYSCKEAGHPAIILHWGFHSSPDP